MILVLVSSSEEEQNKAKAFLEARSFVPVEFGAIRSPDIPADRHLVVTGVRNKKELKEIEMVFEKSSSKVKLAFIGEPKGPDAGELHNSAKLLADNSDETSLELLSLEISKSMADFNRPSWDEYFMSIAKVVATRSNCMKRSVAAVVVKEKQILATGYNGTPRGAVNCNEGGCPRCNSLSPAGADLQECLCCHAEENAITQAAYHGIPLRGTTMYVTLSPCLHCTKLIINAGISEVVFNAEYSMEKQSMALFDQCGVQVRRYSC